MAADAQFASGFWDTYDMPELIRHVIRKGPLGAGSLQVECLSNNGPKLTLVQSIALKIGASLAWLHHGENGNSTTRINRDCSTKHGTSFTAISSLRISICITSLETRHPLVPFYLGILVCAIMFKLRSKDMADRLKVRWSRFRGLRTGREGPLR
jgi:hypothetical protein